MTAFIVRFDAERSFGLVPAPIVTFPVGFPHRIALIGRLGETPRNGRLMDQHPVIRRAHVLRRADEYRLFCVRMFLPLTRTRGGLS